MTQSNYLSPEDFQKFLDAEQDLSYKMMFRVLYGCALRVSEALSICPEHVNLKRRILTIPKSKTGRNQKTSIIPEDVDALEIFLETKREGQRIFPFTRQSAWQHCKWNTKKAGLDLYEQQYTREIEGAWTHLFRKSRAKLMMELGCPIPIIKLKLRHRFKETIEHYLQADFSSLLKWEEENLI